MTIRASRRAGVASVAAMALFLAGCDSLPSLEIFKPGRAAPGANKTAAACVVLDTDMAIRRCAGGSRDDPDRPRRGDRHHGRGQSGGERRVGKQPTWFLPAARTSRSWSARTPLHRSGRSGWDRSRESAERLGYLLATTVPLDPPETFLNQELDKALRRCESVDVVITAPWTSFTIYGPGIGKRLRRVVTQGIPPRKDQAPGFNCSYDLTLATRCWATRTSPPRSSGWHCRPTPMRASCRVHRCRQGLATTGCRHDRGHDADQPRCSERRLHWTIPPPCSGSTPTVPQGGRPLRTEGWRQPN